MVLDVHAVSGVADIFIVATGDSDLQIRAIAESIKTALKEKHDERPWHVEGMEHLQWVLLDCVDLVVHVFSREKREFYSLERLWGDAPSEEVAENGSGAAVSLLNIND